VLDFINKFFRPAPPSGATAKERLRLVLLSDHLSLAPDVVESLKRDLLAVISRYVEIDPAHADVTFERRDHDVAMLASIPITGVRRPGYDQSPEPTPPAPRRARFDAPSASEPASGGVAVAEKTEAPSDPVSLELPIEPEPASPPAVAAVASVAADTSVATEAEPKNSPTSAAHRRRRRRRKASAATKRSAPTQSDPPLNASAQA
jgi:cell division topological specificity factor